MEVVYNFVAKFAPSITNKELSRSKITTINMTINKKRYRFCTFVRDSSNIVEGVCFLVIICRVNQITQMDNQMLKLSVLVVKKNSHLI